MPLAQALVHPAGPPPANPAACRHGHRAPTAQRSRLAHSAALLSHLLLAGLPCPRLQRLASSSFDLCMRRAKLGCCRTTALQAARRRRCQSSGLRRVSDAIAGAVAAAAAATGAARVAASFAGGRGGGGGCRHAENRGVCAAYSHMPANSTGPLFANAPLLQGTCTARTTTDTQCCQRAALRPLP